MTAALDAKNVVITIEDDGPGISDQQRETALAPGIRLDTTVPGTGLGLSISQDLASAYGGELHLGRSEELKGLKVKLVLPHRAGGLDSETMSVESPESQSRGA